MSHHADRFAAGLQDKFWPDTFTVDPGRKYDRVVQHFRGRDNDAHVHAFVERETGYVFKAEGWKRPAKGARYASVDAALEAADLYGGYLYQGAAPGVPEQPETAPVHPILEATYNDVYDVCRKYGATPEAAQAAADKAVQAVHDSLNYTKEAVR